MKSNREYKRRFPWFSASLGVIAVASVATLFVSGQLNAGQGEFGLFVTRIADRLTSAHAGLQSENLHKVSFEDSGSRDGLVVSGFPSYASTSLALVRDQAPRTVRLVLSGEQDVSPEAVTALRVTVNGRRVMERVLAPGRRSFNWVFDLTQELSNEPGARVAFQLMGDLPDHLCHNERSMGAMVSFDARSGLEIELDGPLSSVRDVMALTPRKVTIALQEGEAWLELAARLGASLSRNGYQVDMINLADAAARLRPGERGVILAASPEALQRAGFNPVRERTSAGAGLYRRAGVTMVALTDPARFDTVRFLTSEAASMARGDSIDPVAFNVRQGQTPLIPVSTFGVDTSIHNITNSREWRFDYALSQMPGGRLPEALTVDLRLPEGPDGFTNIAHVQLNGQMIDSRRVAAGMNNRYAVALPAARQGLGNDIAITVQRHRDEGGCAISQQRFPVQLSDESGLVASQTGRGEGFASLPRDFAGGLTVRLPSGLSGQERLVIARVTAETLARFAPHDAALDFQFTETDNGISRAIDRPFLSVNATPSNAQAPLRVYADRVVMDADGGSQVDVRALSNLTLLQASRARINPDAPQSRAVYAPGLIINAIDNAPSMYGARFGSQWVAIVHADGQVIEPASASVAGLAAVMSRP